MNTIHCVQGLLNLFEERVETELHYLNQMNVQDQPNADKNTEEIILESENNYFIITCKISVH